MSTTHTPSDQRTDTGRDPLSRKVFVVAALTCGGAWLVKQAAIALNGGDGSTLIGVLWGIGMLGLVVCAAAGVATLLATRATWLRVSASVLAAPAAFWLSGVIDTVAKSLYTGEGWFRDELGLVLVAVVVSVLALLVRPVPRPR